MQKFCFLLLFLTVTTSNGTSLMTSPVNCATNNTACSVSQDNLLSTFGDVSSLLECRQLCYDTENCSFITYYGQESFPFSKVCMLLKSCEETSPCEGCVSETRNCFKCGFTYTGKLDDNILGSVPGVASDIKCRDECSATPDCQFFTYFTEDHPTFPQLCILQSRLLEPFLPCNWCLTGPKTCEHDLSCGLFVEGEYQTSYKFIEPGVVNNVTLVTDGNGECRVRIFLVGGGGYAHSSSGGGGGGSGFLQYHSQPSTDVLTSVSPIVGRAREQSSVTIFGKNITALPGQASYWDVAWDKVIGGDGYCGGGDYGHSRGGSDGSDGQGENSDDRWQGRGTGEDVTDFHIINFVITPGAGGGYTNEWGNSCGGGGGGVLVDGHGPHRDDGNHNQGEGYGGGGYGRTSSGDTLMHGLPGVVLIEVEANN